jgi:hypothetical protein
MECGPVPYRLRENSSFSFQLLVRILMIVGTTYHNPIPHEKGGYFFQMLLNFSQHLVTRLAMKSALRYHEITFLYFLA